MDAKTLEIDVQLAVGKLYRHRGLEEAETRLRKVVEMDPGRLEAYLELGYRYFFRNDYVRAIQELDKAILVAPRDVRAYGVKGDALAAMGREEEAVAVFETGLKVEPDCLPLLLALGDIGLRRKNFGASLVHFQRALDKAPDDVHAFIGLIWARHSPAGVERVAEKLQLAADERPDIAEIRYALATARRRMGDMARALAELEMCASLDPRNAAVRNNLAAAYAQLGRRDEAVSEWQQALRLQPGHFEAHFNLAHALAASGSHDEAIQQYREAMRINPSFQTRFDTADMLTAHAAAAAPSEEVLHARQVLGRIIHRIGPIWGAIPPIFVEIEAALNPTASSTASLASPEAEHALRRVNRARTALEGILAGMTGMLPASMYEEMAELARALGSAETSLAGLVARTRP